MLILTRHIGETLMVGDEVTVTVLGVKGNQVRIGVNAPKEVAVHREEIYRRIHGDTRPSPAQSVDYDQAGNDFADDGEHSGTISNIVYHRGFGFIYMPGGEENIFFHASDMADDEFSVAQVGDELTFDIEEGDRGPVAKNVQLVA